MRHAFTVGLAAALLALAGPALSGPPNYKISEEHRRASEAMVRGDMAAAAPAFRSLADRGTAARRWWSARCIRSVKGFHRITHWLAII